MPEHQEPRENEPSGLAHVAARLEEIRDLLREAISGTRAVAAELRRLRGASAPAQSAGLGKPDSSAASSLAERLYGSWHAEQRGLVLDELNRLTTTDLRILCRTLKLSVDRKSSKQSLVDAVTSVFSERSLLSSNVVASGRESAKKRS
ncbi:MAG: hypothetical protein HYS14_02375 [Candidatus Rokubacteria bacterium]|nr:hypothetical protein [Candidatus Rokubacteria bacterium]MBI3454859.1 hypothetical protein [Candidatus Rokubacteria bacterium]